MSPEDPERALALSYAGKDAPALAALMALDDALAKLLRTTTEPALGQMRLAWWREALARLDTAPPPAEPVLTALAAEVLPRGVSGASLVPIVHGWEVLVEEEHLDADSLRRFGEGRGTLFERAGLALGAAGDPLAAAGRGWALADLAQNLKAEDEATEARSQSAALLAEAMQAKWSRNARALGALALLARMNQELAPDQSIPVGSPGRVWRLLWHRLTGR